MLIIIANSLKDVESQEQGKVKGVSVSATIGEIVPVPTPPEGGLSGGGGPSGTGGPSGSQGGQPSNYSVIFGYTSPFATVIMDARGLFEQTVADKNGYFAFNQSFVNFLPQEICLTAQDKIGIVSSPTCLPKFPTSYSLNIGPILLPPTLSLDKSKYYAGEEVILTGQSIPNTDVRLSLFIDQKTTFNDYLASFSPIKPVYAFSLPELTTKTDSQGNYSLEIPSGRADIFRLFTQSLYSGQPTGQSRNLTIKILPSWLEIFNLLFIVWNFFITHLFETIIFLQFIIITVFLVRRYLLPHHLASEKIRTIKERVGLIKREYEPTLKKELIES